MQVERFEGEWEGSSMCGVLDSEYLGIDLDTATPNGDVPKVEEDLDTEFLIEIIYDDPMCFQYRLPVTI